MSLAQCKSTCESLSAWGCKFVSWASGASTNWCYVHKACTQPDSSTLTVYEYKGASGLCESLTPSFKFVFRGECTGGAPGTRGAHEAAEEGAAHG